MTRNAIAAPHPKRTATDPLLIEDDAQPPVFLYPLGIPFVALFAFLLLDPQAIPWAFAIALLGGGLAFLATRNGAISVATTGIAPLLVTSDTGLAAALLLGLVTLAWLTGTNLLLLPAVAAFFLPVPHASVFLAFAVALLAAWPHTESRADSSPIFGLPRTHLLDRVALVGAGFLTLAGLLVLDPFWVPILGLVTGLGARILVRHPANARIGATIVRLGVLLAVVPATFFFLLASLDRLPALSGIRVLLLSWGLVAMGLLVLLLAFGVELLMRSAGPGAAVALAAAGTILLAGVGLAFLVQRDAGAVAVSIGWPLLAPWTAVGATRIQQVHPQAGLFLWILVTLLVAVAYGIHVL